MPARSLPASGSDQPWHQISVARGHGRQEAGLLLVGAELEHGGGEQEDPVLADPEGGLGPPVLLFEDQPLEDAHAAAAVLLGPGHHRPAVVGHALLPRPVGLEASAVSREGSEPGAGRMRGQPVPGLGPEGLLGVGVVQVHRLVHRVRPLIGPVHRAPGRVGEI